MADKRHSDRNAPDAETRASRLAELVAELTGTTPGTALHAVRTSPGAPDDRDAFEVLADAIVSVDRPPPEGFRLVGFLRDDDTSDATTPEHPETPA